MLIGFDDFPAAAIFPSIHHRMCLLLMNNYIVAALNNRSGPCAKQLAGTIVVHQKGDLGRVVPIFENMHSTPWEKHMRHVRRLARRRNCVLNIAYGALQGAVHVAEFLPTVFYIGCGGPFWGRSQCYPGPSALPRSSRCLRTREPKLVWVPCKMPNTWRFLFLYVAQESPQ